MVKRSFCIAWLVLQAIMLGGVSAHAQIVNVYTEASAGMGDSIDQVKYQVVYDTQYIYIVKNTKEGKDTIRKQEKMLLQIGTRYSSFFSYPVYQTDSIISSNMARGVATEYSGNGGVIHWKVYRDYPEQGKTAYLDFFAADRYACIEKAENIDWQLTDGTDTICGYLCHKAMARFKGRTWTAWYAEDIPLDNGPWKLCGLPGLILKAADTANDWSFTAVALTRGAASIPIYYKGKDFEPIDRKSLVTLYKKYYHDPIGYLFQDELYANIVVVKDEKGNILKHSKAPEPYNDIEQ